MTKKIFWSIISIAVAVMLATLVIIVGLQYDYFTSLQTKQLRSELSLAAEGLNRYGAGYLNEIKISHSRLTLINADGSIAFDSEENYKKMSNHSDRREFKDAIKYGIGEDARYSKTLTEEMVYQAVKLDDGSVLRISGSRLPMAVILLSMTWPMLLLILAISILSAILAARIAKRIVSPLESLNFDRPLENAVYEELSPILTHMERQRKRIDLQVNQLNYKKQKFKAITENLREGLVLLNNSNEVVSINKSALGFFANKSPAYGVPFNHIDRTVEISKAIEATRVDGKAKLNLTRNGKEYALSLSSIMYSNDDVGVEILILDRTEAALTEKIRKEFSANVSHELKTPIQTIIGRAELLENNLVKPEDTADFLKDIREKASNLLTLINDIIRLSQIDEGTGFTFEEVDLYQMALAERDFLSEASMNKKIAVKVSGSGRAWAVKQLIHEIIYNLLDNAIRYTGPDGLVTIELKDNEIKVSDNGIGISQEHIARIFERFYRVDKSRSGESGGTGLGLSIVKNSVKYLGGTVSVESIPNKGTAFIVRLP
ncbi:two-component system, OmpR family, phosphate regulon sensor histidine kinase PhoR [Peptostreptococcaceae bacterium pGA-8]|nr:two-component system, OmpR family, phosphate regulon sensor histidine kinase PhoR [Peptostreptococcaceae bacterium pGA-8]